MKAKQQVRLDIKSNAGGAGKTTTAIHIAYGVAQRGYSVVLVDLDPQGTFNVFVGLPRETPRIEDTLAAVLSDSFKGDYPLHPVWKDKINGVFVLQGGSSLYTASIEVNNDPRGPYILQDRLADYPLDVDLIIFDSGATLEPLPLLSLAASTHVLVTLQPEFKSMDGISKFFEWFYYRVNKLRLRPEPKLLGVLPVAKETGFAAHEAIVEALPAQLNQMGIHMFPEVRHSREFVNASGYGLPLGLWRPRHPACNDFKPVIDTIVKLLKGGKA